MPPVSDFWKYSRPGRVIEFLRYPEIFSFLFSGKIATSLQGYRNPNKNGISILYYAYFLRSCDSEGWSHHWNNFARRVSKLSVAVPTFNKTLRKSWWLVLWLYHVTCCYVRRIVRSRNSGPEDAEILSVSELLVDYNMIGTFSKLPFWKFDCCVSSLEWQFVMTPRVNRSFRTAVFWRCTTALENSLNELLAKHVAVIWTWKFLGLGLIVGTPLSL